MKRRVGEGLREFLQSERGGHGAGYAILAGLIAYALVLTASIFGQDLLGLLNDFTCDASPSCVVAFERIRPTTDAPRPLPAAFTDK
jgi:Flp pilus assembly pilin Flp